MWSLKISLVFVEEVKFQSSSDFISWTQGVEDTVPNV